MSVDVHDETADGIRTLSIDRPRSKNALTGPSSRRSPRASAPRRRTATCASSSSRAAAVPSAAESKCLEGPEMGEGVMAFFEKREPRFPPE